MKTKCFISKQQKCLQPHVKLFFFQQSKIQLKTGIGIQKLIISIYCEIQKDGVHNIESAKKERLGKNQRIYLTITICIQFRWHAY